MPSSLPRNAYTNAPEQHPNWILGSLQLLFWLVFRPSAWGNYLKLIDPALDPDRPSGSQKSKVKSQKYKKGTSP